MMRKNFDRGQAGGTKFLGMFQAPAVNRNEIFKVYPTNAVRLQGIALFPGDGGVYIRALMPSSASSHPRRG